ncbi:MAG TPA: Calx-beta domain-containing protein [Thermoanaerobaculia bacterium]
MKIQHRPILPALALGFLLAAAAFGQHHGMNMGKVDYDHEPGGGDPNAPANCQGVQAKVQITGTVTAFSPSTITIDPGQPVCWTWSATYDSHNVKADDGSFTSGEPATSGNFQKTFNTPGTYGFHCQVHGNPNGSGMHGTIVVRDTSGGGGGDDGPGKIQLASTAMTVNEGAGPLTVTVERVDGGEGVATVKYAVAPGTAKPGKDYNPRAGLLRWEDGEQGAKTFDVVIKNDSAIEPDEGFSIKLSKATRAALGAATATVTVHDDDAPSCNQTFFAPSKLRASGQSASEIRLAWDDESAAAGMLKIERRQPGGAFREIASLAPGVGAFTDSGLPEGVLFQYRIRAVGEDGNEAFSAIAAGATDGSTAPCDEAKALCLLNGRFEATVEWQGGLGHAAKRLALPEIPNSGLFSASPNGAPQLLLNVHDGCAVNARFWLDFAAVTDAELLLKVRDTQTGRTWVYFNPAGNAPLPVRDLNAFATCP